jgi:hypothetical protein
MKTFKQFFYESKEYQVKETKSAPAGHYFTKSGNLVKGRLGKDERDRGATKSDPKDKQRSKVPPVSQVREGLWANINAKKKRGGKSASKGSKAYKAAKKAGDKLEATKESVANENFKDGKKKGKSRPGRVKRAGASCNGSVASLRKKAKNSGGERGKMYHWCANMKGGKNK